MMFYGGLPPTFKACVTVYNRVISYDSNGRSITEWKRCVVNHCNFVVRQTSDKRDGIITYKTSAKCYIAVSDKYVYPGSFTKNSRGFTLKPGDIIVNGIVTDEIKDIKGFRATDLAEKYKNRCLVIRDVSINDKIPFGQHYLAVGI